jgi:hypothetical protein
MNIRLHIDRLIVDGLPMTALQAHALRASVEVQLATLLTAAPPHAATGYAAPSLLAAPISWNSSANNTSAAARAIARSLHTALVPNASPQRSSK